MESSSKTLKRLIELLDIIEESAKSLRAFLQRSKFNSPWDELDYSARIARKLELPFHEDSTIACQASVLRIACERLGRLVTPPRHLVFEAAGSFYTTMALQIALKHDLATLIKGILLLDATKDGVSATDLALKCKLDADLLARILRYLSQRGIFQELEPGIFANTVASLTLADNPEFKAHLDLVIYEGQLASPHFDRYMQSSPASREGESTDSSKLPTSAFALFSGGVSFFQWMHLAENMNRGKNFGLAMRGMTRTEGIDFLPVDYPFSLFGPNTVVVDVGGGIGSLAELLIPAVPHLRFVIQDLEPVVTLAHEVASPNMKSWITQGKVEFQVHDLFSPQHHTLGRSVFILKNIIHNHPDSKALEILTTIRPSKPSKLLIIDRLITPVFCLEATAESKINQKSQQNTQLSVVPVSSQGIPTMYDLIMGSLHGGRTRTLEEWQKLLLDGGFRLLEVYPLRASTGQVILEAAPI